MINSDESKQNLQNQEQINEDSQRVEPEADHPIKVDINANGRAVFLEVLDISKREMFLKIPEEDSKIKDMISNLKYDDKISLVIDLPLPVKKVISGNGLVRYILNGSLGIEFCDFLYEHTTAIHDYVVYHSKRIKDELAKEHIATQSDHIKILVIDDPEIGNETVTMLKKLYYDEVSQAFDEDKIWEYLLQTELVILNLDMEKTNGMKLLQQIRKHRKVYNCPVIILTKKADRTLIIKAMELRICGILIYPFSIETFSVQMHEALLKIRNINNS